ncbi:glutamyl-tRNA amidotransferase subunit A [Rhexocercosporidium sp. MPI-PUGE-AT-0058]|nr:glutamyl-tRNA amidotransferase subunit A [Rhexocercosporidium sp. MPI-PUGE-AT-0058]
MGFTISRYTFLLLALFLILITGSVGTAFVLRAANSADYPSLLDASIESLSSGLARRKFTSVDLVKAYLARIAEVQEDFHAVTEVNPDALLIAADLDAERLDGSIRGPLHGIPLLIKNIIATDDKMNNTAGSWALLGAKVPRDATVAKKLRDAGAILLGKSSLTQWANFRSDNSSNGWSSLGGQVYGPYFPRQDPWGSSSGSGVATALGLASGCLGTETDGSITSPASSNNVVGIKPTVGLTSRYLVIPISEHQDTVGPMARSVKDAAYILQAIAGPDSQDNYTSTIPHVPNYVKACKHSSLSGMRLGIPRNAISLALDSSTQPQIKALSKAIKVLRAAGATVIDNTNFTAAEEFWNSEIPGRVLEADFTVNLQGYLTSLTSNPNDIHSLDQLRNFTQHSLLEEYPLRDTGVWDAALSGWNNTDPRFWPAYQQNLYYGDDGGLLGAMERFKLDAIVMPADFAAHWAATVGTPIVTVPLGFYPSGTPVVKDSWGLVESAPKIPFGISFMGRKFSEDKLIGMAYAFEQRTKVRDIVQPYIVPKTKLSDVV